jgi:hypothetical protein
LIALLYWFGLLGWYQGTLVVAWPSNFPCSDALNERCTEPDAAVVQAYSDANACAGPERHVCLVPIGGVTPEQIEVIRSNVMNNLGIEVVVLPPMPVPQEALNQRRGQYESLMLELQMSSKYQELVNRESLLIGLTPVDVYIGDTGWRWAFGQLSRYQDLGDPDAAIVATNRMATGKGVAPRSAPGGLSARHR